ncbi:hypothetical protein Zmor_003540 [Zophobas morio]|uniref:Uncharacterized protein n=1 Tax=Zophobas morio TaxID=2755281 RepID=A0AA38HMX1_9CUCU|nr:hypothetical protein Zmor_003540 [Zophobas morio]
MSSYVVTYKQGESPQIEAVKVTLKTDTVLFYYSNGERLSFLEDSDIQTFDDTVPGEVTLFLHGQPNTRLVFIEQVQVDAFIEALKRVLAFSNRPSPESGRSTLSSASS